jgi:hypothetical protein
MLSEAWGNNGKSSTPGSLFSVPRGFRDSFYGVNPL